MIFGFARIYLCKRLAKSELKLANWKLGFQFSNKYYGRRKRTTIKKNLRNQGEKNQNNNNLN